MTQFDVAVCGLGVMGSAALRELSRRGLRAIGIDRFSPGHGQGSSHGATRIIRLAYFEHPSYVPLLRRSYELWRQLEDDADEELLHVTGIAEIGPADGLVIRGALTSIKQHGLRHELLSAHELSRQFPVFRLPSQYVALVQPDGGFLEAEQSIHAMLALAKQAGAVIRCGEPVRSVEPQATGVKIVTDRDTIKADAAIITAGAWIKSLIPDLHVPLRITRQVIGWFSPEEPSAFLRGPNPVFLIESRHGIHYGFPPDANGRIKVAKHHHRNESVDPDACDRAVSTADEALIRTALADHIPAANGHLIDAKTCLYTMTPDGDFLIDHLPNRPQIIVASPCSGHGFKFAPVIGEILVDLATTGVTPHDIERFSLKRFC